MKKYKILLLTAVACLSLSGCKCEYPEIFIYVRKLTFPTEELTDGKAVIVVGQMKNLQVTVNPWNATMQDIRYTSSDENVFIVDQKGVITGTGAGTAELTATAPDEKGVFVKCEVVVTINSIPVQSIKFLNIENNTVTHEEGFILNRSDINIEVLPETATDRTYTLSVGNEDIAYIDQDGNLVFENEGETTLTAKANDGSNISATITVIVKAP